MQCSMKVLKGYLKKMSSKIKTTLKISIFCAFICYCFSRYVDRMSDMADNRRILSELITERKTIKAYVSGYYGRHRGRFKKDTFIYRFMIDNQEYKGISSCKGNHLYPEVGDSIWVYYKEDDPNVNLWVGMFSE